jgi:hypothetical protein
VGGRLNINKIYLKGVLMKKKVLSLFGIICLLSTTIVFAQDFCKGNFDYDQDQDGSDAFTFKEDFGRSTFGNPCPTDGPAPVEKTRLTTCYSVEIPWEEIDCAGTGQDGELQKGVAWPDQRFTDNLDGTVTDHLTGLRWLKDGNCFGERTWGEALSDCNGLSTGSCGLSDGSGAGDWRLPNVKELQSLIDYASARPALPSGCPFTNVEFTFWSSTNNADYVWIAWHVSLVSGSVSYDNKTDLYAVLPVRGGH